MTEEFEKIKSDFVDLEVREFLSKNFEIMMNSGLGMKGFKRHFSDYIERMKESQIGKSKWYCKQCKEEFIRPDKEHNCPCCGAHAELIQLVWCRCADCEKYLETYHACDACGGTMDRENSKEEWFWCQWFYPKEELYSQYIKPKELSEK
ncbi:MAG: hypothetical protein R6U96_14710 [Promethearchaeia archaeon]